MCPLTCPALPIAIHHSRSAELIFVFVPPKCHLHIRRVCAVDFCLIECESSLHRFAGENHAREICLLQKLYKLSRDRGVMTNYIKQNGPSVADDHDLTRFWLAQEFCHGIEAGF